LNLVEPAELTPGVLMGKVLAAAARADAEIRPSISAADTGAGAGAGAPRETGHDDLMDWSWS